METKRAPSSNGKGPLAGPFFQPLALAGVFLVFVALLLSMAAMDFRTLDKTLAGHMEKQGFDFIKAIQQAAGFNLKQMDSAREWDLNGDLPKIYENQTGSVQEFMVLAILQLAQRIDYERDNGALSDEDLRSLASGQGLWNLALFNERGDLTFKIRSVPDTIQRVVSGMVRNHQDLKIQIFEPLASPLQTRYFSLRRRNDKGFVVLMLNQGSFRFWKLKSAVEMAVADVEMPSNSSCLSIADREGLILFQSPNCGETSGGDGAVWAPSEKGAKGSGRKVAWNGRKALILYQNISLNQGSSLVVRLTLHTDDLDRMLAREKAWGIMAIGFMVLLVVLSMGFLYRNQNRHIARIREMERRLHQAERLSAMGRLASGVAHEIRNPLNAISMASQRLKPDNLEQLTPVIRDEIKRLNLIIEEFLGLSKGRALKLEEGDLADLVRQVGLLMGEASRSKGVNIETKGTETPFMMVMDGNKIKQALINMVKNAVEAISESGTVTLALRSKEGVAAISISDTGMGMAEKDVDEIFNLDFTTKEKGLGLGLALAHEIVEAHGGEITVRSKAGMGTTFLIRIPVQAPRRSKYI